MRRRLQPVRAARGFTLVEVLVAMFIMAILAVMAWQGVDGIVRTRDASQARLEQTLRLNTVMAQWEHDLAALQDSQVVDSFAFDGATVRLTRRAERGLQVVTWSLLPAAEGTTGGGTLLRWASPPATGSNELQETWMRTLQFQGVEPGQLPALKGIAQWQLYCAYSSGMGQGAANFANCQSTGNVPAPAPTASAPRPPRPPRPDIVRLVIEFSGDINGSLTRDVQVMR
jgi:general secretion pathway protein J